MASRVPRNSRLRDLEEGIPKLKNMCQFASLPASESGEANETRVWSVLQDLSPRVSESSNSTVIRIDWHEKIMAQTAPQMLKTCVDYMQLIPDIGFFVCHVSVGEGTSSWKTLPSSWRRQIWSANGELRRLLRHDANPQVAHRIGGPSDWP